MADNVTLNPGSGGSVIATDDISGLQYQRCKLIQGNDGVNDGDISKTNPLPIAIFPGDNPVVDAFGRIRISNPQTIFDSKLVETNGSLFWNTVSTGGGNGQWLYNDACWQLSVNDTNGAKTTRQTKEYFGYQAGKSQNILITGVMGAIKTNVRQRIGYFDDNNGLFWEQSGGTLKVVRRTSATESLGIPTPVNNSVNQASWNLDTMDGNGPSGITIDMTKTQIFFIDFAWLGVGRVRMGFVIDGLVYYCHEFINTNILTGVYMSRPNLPIRFELENTGTPTSSTTMKQICSTVISEGGYNPPGVIRSVDNGTTTKTLSSTLIPIISLRKKSENIRSLVKLFKLHFAATNNQPFHWRLLHNTTLTSASWVQVSSTSICEYDVSATALSGGEVLLSGYVFSGDSQDLSSYISRLNLGSTISGTSDIVTIAGVRLGNTDSAGVAALMFEEHY
jgi:hypothetical protein